MSLNESIPIELLKRIRSIRVIHGYSQTYVASKLNISQKAYSYIESGHTNLSVTRLNRIADIYNLTLSQLITDIPIQSPHQNLDQTNCCRCNAILMNEVVQLIERLLQDRDITVKNSQRPMDKK